MITKAINYIRFLRKINIRQFFYLNYMCSKVVRIDESKIIPYKNTIINVEKGAKIYIVGGNIELGCDSLSGSKAETRIRLRKNAVWSAIEGARISYGTTVEILNGALLNSKYFTMNSNCTMVVAKRIDLGYDVMIGRNVIIYDSDYHQIINESNEIINPSLAVKIGDHVWLATNCMILKGAQISSGCVIGANSVVNGSVPIKTMYYIKKHFVMNEGYGDWKRERP